MKFVIGNECMACGRCFRKCPLGCIWPGEETYVIDAEACVQCGACRSVCPIGAIHEEE